jgi:hypothetical protein
MSKNTSDAAAAREEFLEEDAEIPGQKFCLLSFLSPEKVLKKKELYLFEKFLQTYEFQSRIKSLEGFLMKTANGVNTRLDAEADRLDALDLSGAATECRKARVRVDQMMDEFQQFQKENERELRESKLKEFYDDFIFANKAKLEDEFFALNEFRTTVRGLKIRGTYGNKEEAILRSKKLQRSDPLHNIYVAEVGKWLPWDPEPTDVAEQEYAEEQLNTLMKKYKENEEQREQFQREQRARATKKPGSEIPGGGSITVLNDDAAAAASAGPVADSQPTPLEMFGSEGPADLAIQRKMANLSTE